MEAKNRDLEEKIKNQDAVIEQLRSLNQRQFDNIAELQKEIDSATEKNRNLSLANSELFVEKLNLETKAYELREEIEKLKDGKYYRTVLDRNKELIVENANLKNRLHQKTEEYGTKIMAMSADMDKLQEENTRLNKCIDNLTEHSSCMGRRVTELQNKLERIEEIVED